MEDNKVILSEVFFYSNKRQYLPVVGYRPDALFEGQSDLANGRGGQTIGGRQPVAAHVGFRDIDGAAVHLHGMPGLADQGLQGLLEGIGLGHALDDTSQFR